MRIFEVKFYFNIIFIVLILSGTIYAQPADSLNTISLEKLIVSAHALYANSVEGMGEGQYKSGSKAILLSAINEAETFVNQSQKTQTQIDSVLWHLADVCVVFETGAVAGGLELIDKKPTKETRYLYSNLDKLSYDYLIFGMHDATGYGVGWKNDDDRSDVKDVCGSYPAVYSEDMYHVMQNHEVDRLRYRVTNAYNRGGIITMPWHQLDPLGRSFYASKVNNERIVETLLPGGEYYDFYKEKLYNMALFFKTLRGINGESIPVIFRPYHEHTGSWFWWGDGHCTANEYIEIWRFTVIYLRDTLNVHNLIYALSPSAQHIDSVNDYFNIYPGDEYVDIFGVDKYFGYPVSDRDKNIFLQKMRCVVQASNERNKQAALTEVGQEKIPTTNFFTDVLLDPIKRDSLASKISFAAVWRNAHTEHHFAPYPGHPSVADFIKFYEDPYTLFQDNLPDVYKPLTADTTTPKIIEYPLPGSVFYYTDVLIEIVTDERAYLKYSLVDEDYEQMPYSFSTGQETRYHSVIVAGIQGEQGHIFIRAKDVFGNIMDSSVQITFTVDTLLRPVGWIEPDYNTNDWLKGNAPFLFMGESGEGCKIQNSRTVYFRKEFNIEKLDSVNQLVAFLKYDNGAVLYLNGKKLRKTSMPDGETDYNTYAFNNSGSFVTYTLGQVDLQCLKNGKNIIAIEIHQSQTDSSDLFFDFYLFSPDVLINYGSEWQYYSNGRKPPDRTLGSLGIDDNLSVIPAKFKLEQNYPNPFNPITNIKYSLAESDRVIINVYDVLGREIATLIDKYQIAGNYAITFNGSHLASGVYYYRAQTTRNVSVHKMIILK